MYIGTCFYPATFDQPTEFLRQPITWPIIQSILVVTTLWMANMRVEVVIVCKETLCIVNGGWQNNKSEYGDSTGGNEGYTIVPSRCRHPLPPFNVQNFQHRWCLIVTTGPGFCGRAADDLAVRQISSFPVFRGIGSPVPPVKCRIDPWIFPSLKVQQMA